MRRIDAVVTPTGAAFVDGGIIGPPPGQSGNPTFYFSGQAAPALAGLSDLGLNVRIMKAPLGAASALKMSYAEINKGTTLLAAAMLLGATRAGPPMRSAPNYRKAGQSFWIAMPDQYRTCIQKLIAGRPRWKRSPNSSATIPPPALSSRGLVTRTIARLLLTGKMAHDDLVRPLSISACDHPARILALCAFHTQLSRRRRSAR